MRARALIAVLVLAGVVAVPALASASARREVANCTKSQVRPATLNNDCRDTFWLTHLEWSSFGAATARATGEFYLDGCTPNCVLGKFHSYAIKLVVSQAKPCPDGDDDYRAATVTFTDQRPPGEKRQLGTASSTFTLGLSCPPRE